MNFIAFLPLKIFAMQTGELLLALCAALLTGYTVKWLLDKYVLKPKADPAEELEEELETLQEKYSAQMFQKEEDLKMLQDEVKAAEKKNLDLKIEYAKAINHIEKLKANPSEQDENGEALSSSNNVHNEVLLSVKEKIVKQEELIETLQDQLQETAQKKNEFELLYEQSAADLTEYQTRLELMKNEMTESVTMLKEEIKIKEELLKTNEAAVQSASETIASLQQQLSSAQNNNSAEVNTEVERLKNEIEQLQTKLSLSDWEEGSKSGIQTIRMEAEQVTTMIENFKQHLTATLDHTYSYEQLLNKNEKLNGVVDQLLAEKQQVENELLSFKQQLHQNNDGLNQQLQQKEQELKQVQQLLEVAQKETNMEAEQWKQQIELKEKELADVIQEKNNLELTYTSLQQKLSEKEKFSKQMMEVVKEFEDRILQIYPAAELPHAGTIVLENGEMQYR